VGLKRVILPQNNSGTDWYYLLAKPELDKRWELRESPTRLSQDREQLWRVTSPSRDVLTSSPRRAQPRHPALSHGVGRSPPLSAAEASPRAEGLGWVRSWELTLRLLPARSAHGGGGRLAAVELPLCCVLGSLFYPARTWVLKIVPV